jgi:hypothetical protein
MRCRWPCGIPIIPPFPQCLASQGAIAMHRRLFLALLFGGLASLAGCMSPPTGLNLSLDRLTAQDKYRVAVHSLADPIVVNKMHSWEVQVRSPADHDLHPWNGSRRQRRRIVDEVVSSGRSPTSRPPAASIDPQLSTCNEVPLGRGELN